MLRTAQPIAVQSAARALCIAASLVPPHSPRAATCCKRPTIDDAIAISFGRRAKARGTGSRAVPHRLNLEERGEYDRARRKGFAELHGSGWRKERGDSPLRNSWRLLSDAAAKPAIMLHKGGGDLDEVLIDLSPLRVPGAFEEAVGVCLTLAPDGLAEPLAPRDPSFLELSQGGFANEDQAPAPTAPEPSGPEARAAVAEAYAELPIFKLPIYAVSWLRPRSEAKALARRLAAAFGTPATGTIPSASKHPKDPKGKAKRRRPRSRVSEADDALDLL